MEQVVRVQTRQGWVDATRAIALLLLVAAHYCDPFNSPLFEQTPERALWGSVYLSILRPCVPLFVMITGYLLLPGGKNVSAHSSARVFSAYCDLS